MKNKSSFSRYITILVMIFFYLPMIIMTINSFNNTNYGVEWSGFTIEWYKQLLTDTKILYTLINSLIIGICATLTSMVIGTLSALVIHHYKSKIQIFHQALVFTQLGVPDILMGMSLLLFFIAIHLRLGLLTIYIAHVTFCISYVSMVVLGRLQNFDFKIIEAAKDLGADWYVITRKIFLPLISPGIIAGGLLAFTLSIDDFVITFFVTGPGSSTLPIYIYSMMKHGSPAVLNALSVLFLVVTFILVYCAQQTIAPSKTK